MPGAAVIMGAGDALGGAIARRFSREGLVAVPSSRKILPLGELVAEIEADGGQAEGIPCDARDEEAVIELFDGSRMKSGRSRRSFSIPARSIAHRSLI